MTRKIVSNRFLVGFTIIAISISAMGCATIKDVGSEPWYNHRLQEIETSYSNNEITKAEYLALKGQLENTYHLPRTPRRVKVY